MRIKRLFYIVAALLLTLPHCVVAGAATEKTQTVRVGYFAFSGYHEMEQDGRMKGYGYDFLQKLGAHTDWTYKYIGYDASFSQSLTMLDRGEIDVLTFVSKTDKRLDKYLFSDKPIGTNPTIFTVKAGNENVIPGDYSTYDGLTIGMIEGSAKNEDFDEFAKEHNFKFNPVYFATEKELDSALQNDKLDGIVAGSMRDNYNEWVIETIAVSNFYIVTRKDRPDLMKQINEAVDELDIDEADWRGTLYSKYYAIDSAGQVLLDAEERLFLHKLKKNGESLKILVNPDRKPYSYFEDGRARGIFPEVFVTIAERLGLSYEFVEAKNRNDYYHLRESKEVDIILDFVSDYYTAEQEGYKITNPYINMSFARLTLKNFTGEINSVACNEHSDILDSYIKGAYSSAHIMYFPAVSDCVQAVADGTAQATVLFTYTAEQVLQEDVTNRFDFTYLNDASLSFSMGVNEKEDHTLLSVLNKGVDSISRNDLSAIVSHETEMGKLSAGKDFISFIYDNPLYGFLAALLIFLLIFVCFVLFFRMRAQKILQKRIDEVSGQYEEQKKELSDALVLADQANRAKTTFLNNMSHDIRTPMNAIIGFTTLATTHLEDKSRIKDYLGKISQSSNHLLSLINDVLDMSRIESGNVNIENKPENLPEILHGIRNIIQADIRNKRLDLFVDTVEISNENIICDKLRLNQIILNLVSNAIKFTEPGGRISLCVTQKTSSNPGYGVYEFRVKDNGIGMSAEFAKTIFEPFTRERTSTVSGIQGTGLGMSITKNIVDMMNGTIEVFSEPGKGTEFVINLEFELNGENQEIEPIVELEGLRALVVDDDILSCQSVSKMLRNAGMKAGWTMYGKEAVIRTKEALDEGDPYQVYVIDWSMPDMNGIETVRQIRRVIGQEAPIILLSAYDWGDIEEEGREAGVTGFISKPLFASDLQRAFAQIFRKSEEEKAEALVVADNAVEGKRLLLVEDNELNREIATEILTEAGFELESAENGQIACDMVQQAEPGYYDMILMDVQMPVMDGYTATENIRQMDSAHANIPIVAMTANAFEEDRKRAMEAGMDGHLAKPLEIDKMMELLQEMLQKG